MAFHYYKYQFKLKLSIWICKIITVPAFSILGPLEEMACLCPRNLSCSHRSNLLKVLFRSMLRNSSSSLFFCPDLRSWKSPGKRPFLGQRRIPHHASTYRLQFLCQSCPNPSLSLNLLDKWLFPSPKLLGYTIHPFLRRASSQCCFSFP